MTTFNAAAFVTSLFPRFKVLCHLLLRRRSQHISLLSSNTMRIPYYFLAAALFLLLEFCHRSVPGPLGMPSIRCLVPGSYSFQNRQIFHGCPQIPTIIG